MAEQVHGLWMQSKLSFLEKLTIKSFIENGAEFNLWYYEPINSEVPEGCILRDGREILPEKDIFLYPKEMILGFGGSSYVGFSELFRYRVMYEHGGWWSDMDVTCLKHLSEIKEDYWFRDHGVLSLVGNIMKVPPKSDLMKVCYERSKEVVNAQCTDWHLAIRILCFEAEIRDLHKYIHRNECNLDRLNLVNAYMQEPNSYDKLIDPNWRFIHWCNSVLNKNYVEHSVMDMLLKKYKLSTFIML